MTAYQSLVEKLVSLLKIEAQTSKTIFPNHQQEISASLLSQSELTTYIENSEYDDQDEDEYGLAFNLGNNDLALFTAEEIKTFCGDKEQPYITVIIWVNKDLCKDIDTDNGICDVESWEYTWHGW